MKKRIPIFLLLTVVILCYYGQYNINKRIDNAMNHCYEISKDASVCDEMYDLLEVEDD